MSKRAHAEIGSVPERRQVAARLAAVRAALDLSKAAFADRLRCDRSTYGKIEAGERDLPLPVAWRLYAMHGFSLDFIYDGKLHGVPSHHRDAVLASLSAAGA